MPLFQKKDDVIIGYIAWMYFDFHNEKSAFCPIVGLLQMYFGENTSNPLYFLLDEQLIKMLISQNKQIPALFMGKQLKGRT